MSPRLLFLPGASGAADFWLPVAERMAGGRDIRRLSWPGAGAEPHDPSVRGYEDLINRTAAEISEPADVVAHSMGGIVALGLAVQRPEKVRRLVLVGTSGGLDIEPFNPEDWRESYRREFPGAASWVTEQRVDHGPALDAVAAPSCLIWGEADPISPPEVGRALQATLPRSVLHVLAGATHALPRERPNEVAAIIAAHLR